MVNSIDSFKAKNPCFVNYLLKIYSIKRINLNQSRINRGKGEGLRNIQNTGRWNYSAIPSRQVSIYRLL